MIHPRSTTCPSTQLEINQIAVASCLGRFPGTDTESSECEDQGAAVMLSTVGKRWEYADCEECNHIKLEAFSPPKTLLGDYSGNPRPEYTWRSG